MNPNATMTHNTIHDCNAKLWFWNIASRCIVTGKWLKTLKINYFQSYSQTDQADGQHFTTAYQHWHGTKVHWFTLIYLAFIFAPNYFHLLNLFTIFFFWHAAFSLKETQCACSIRGDTSLKWAGVFISWGNTLVLYTWQLTELAFNW